MQIVCLRNIPAAIGTDRGGASLTEGREHNVAPGLARSLADRGLARIVADDPPPPAPQAFVEREKPDVVPATPAAKADGEPATTKQPFSTPKKKEK